MRQHRGPEKFPHWHDATEWAKRTTMTEERLKAETIDTFYAWMQKKENDSDVRGFFYGVMQWPEGLSYCFEYDYLRLTAFPTIQRAYTEITGEAE